MKDRIKGHEMTPNIMYDNGHCRDWHKKGFCNSRDWPGGYNYEKPDNGFCASCVDVHHPPCCDYCCA